MTRKVLYDYDKDGFRAELFCHVGQWGTHVDPPAHFHKGMTTADRSADADAAAARRDRRPPESREESRLCPFPGRRDGVGEAARPVPRGAFVAMRTDWAKRWPSQAKMQNVDAAGTAHYPGWSMAALKYLYETRHITASGHETTDTDPGLATTKDDYTLESYILGLGHYQIELLANLDQVPEAGALVSVTWPDIHDGTGFPARVYAILP